MDSIRCVFNGTDGVANESLPSALDTARTYVDQKCSPIPIPHKQKAPASRDWQKLRLGTEPELAAAFGTEPVNIGLLLGAPSNGLVDVDLDCDEVISLAPTFLPPSREFGRTSRPRSHRLYRATGNVPRVIRFQDPIVVNAGERATLVELRGTGGQTIVPWSTHPSGERVRWENDLPIVDADGDVLHRVVAKLAAAALLVRHWPASGSRHDCSLAFAGGLLRGGMSAEHAEEFISAIARAAGDEEATARAANVVSSVASLSRNDPTTGWPTMEKFIDPKVVAMVRKWLKMSSSSSASFRQVRKPGSAAALLVQAAADVEFFRTPDDEPYGRIPVAEHVENHHVRSRAFRHWLIRRLHDEDSSVIAGAQAVGDAITTLEARALASEEIRVVHLRIGGAGNETVIDLCNRDWQVVEVTSKGWKVSSSSADIFRRPRGMTSMPLPEQGGQLEELRPFLNLASEQEFRLAIAWLLAALRREGPYPILCLQGPQGSAKSTAGRVFRRTIDPSKSPLRSFPRSERDLVIAAENSWCLSFDNLSGVSVECSDSLCRLATGGGFGTRRLYENRDEEFFDAARPVIVNGIDDIATRGDLADRCVVLQLPPISPDKRRDERSFWAAFDNAHPRIFGALLDVMSKALAFLPTISLEAKPRMADFALLGVAIERALSWPDGSFMDAYSKNQQHASNVAMEADVVAMAIVELAAQQAVWVGTASDLLERLRFAVDESTRKSRAWPHLAHHLSNRLRRAVEPLKVAGVQVTFDRTGVQRTITIEAA